MSIKLQKLGYQVRFIVRRYFKEVGGKIDFMKVEREYFGDGQIYVGEIRELDQGRELIKVKDLRKSYMENYCFGS